MKKIMYACAAIVFLAGCATAAKNSPNEMKLKIAHYKVPCSGESVQLCFVIKKDNGEKEFFYDQIEGFDYQWGYDYELTVEKRIIKLPKADMSSNTYKLIKIIKKEKVSPGTEFELPVKFNDEVVVLSEKGSCNYFNEIRIQTGSYSCAELAKAEAAIFKYGADSNALVLVRIKS